MIKPTKYKSISISQLELRPIVSISTTHKEKVLSTLQKLTDLIKLKHA
jgi:hypothetical protein